MSRRIDRIVTLICACVVALWLFLNATGHLPASLFLTCLWGALAAWALDAYDRSKPGVKRREQAKRLRAAKALVLNWAMTPSEMDARAHIVARYPECARCHFALLARHPSAPPLDASELLAIWRAHSGAPALLLAATGPVAPAAAQVASALTAPRVRLLDGAALSHVLAQSGLPIAEAPLKRTRPRFFLGRKRAPLMLLYALFMFVLYWLIGQILYLVLGLLLLAACAVALHGARPPDRLFS
ncbi:MAG: hypothetical protein RR452_03305 [Clostridia bacterium]